MATNGSGKQSVSILHLEDNPADGEFFRHKLGRDGLECSITLVETREDFIRELGKPEHDIILSDNAMPHFSGREALALAKSARPDLPFIFLSGSIGEEAAIEALKEGATDYILKDRFSRLAAAISRAMEEKEERAIRRRAEKALRASEERYALAAVGANDGLWDWDLKSGTVYYSARWKSMLGHAEEEIGGSLDEWLGRIHPEEAGLVRLQIDRHLEGATAKLECEYRIRTRQGNYLWVLCRGVAVRGADGAPYRIAGSQGDITERKRAEEQLLYDAFHDSLTGLVNRNLFHNSLQRLLEMGKRKDGVRFSVLHFGLDRFGTLNDGLGRQIGDIILKESAGRITQRLRPGDTLARLSGGEFAVLMEDMDSLSEVIRTARSIQAGFQSGFLIGGQEIYVTLSAGIVQGADGYQTPEEVLRDAGIALGKAKSQGPENFCVFDQAMHAQAVSLLGLETDLRHAIAKDEFYLQYQPIMDLRRGTVAGFEALVRWQHPVKGLIPPMDFIPVAEESFFINEIGRIVLEKACRQMRRWQTEYPAARNMSVSVNVSGRQFRQSDLIDQIKGILSATDLDPKCLKLEVTETAIMHDPKTAADMLAELGAEGIGLQIDDFGTGYSSLAYLHRFPMHALKIDRSFVNLIGENGENTAISSSVVAMAHNLGMQVIAEGIETPVQLRILKELACDYGQGFFFNKPLSVPDAERLIASQTA